MHMVTNASHCGGETSLSLLFYIASTTRLIKNQGARYPHPPPGYAPVLVLPNGHIKMTANAAAVQFCNDCNSVYAPQIQHPAVATSSIFGGSNAWRALLPSS